MKRFIDINGIDNKSTKNQFGNKEHRADYNKIIGVLVCPVNTMNYSLSINDGEQIVIGTSIESVSKVAPNKRFFAINKNVTRGDIIRVSFRQSLTIDDDGVNTYGKIYLLVE